MGDHRANIKLEFTIHGKTYKTELAWINYTDNGEGVDRRIVDWFSECWRDAYCRYEDQIAAYHEEQNKAQNERLERQELVRLKAKYEHT